MEATEAEVLLSPDEARRKRQLLQRTQLVTAIKKAIGQRKAGARRLVQWAEAAAAGGVAANTFQALSGDLLRFGRFCSRSGYCSLPATSEGVIAFIQDRVGAGKRPATIRRHLASIAKAHRVAKLPNPCDEELVTMAMSTASKALHGDRQKQSAALLGKHLEAYLAISPEVLRDYRDRAMVLMAYDTRCRSEELVALDIEHVTFDEDGSATVLIARAKNDQGGRGAEAYLSQLTVVCLRDWLDRAHLQTGAIFRVIQGKKKLLERMLPPSVATVFYRIGLQIGMSWKEARQLTGHAARVGTTQDSLAAGIDEGAIKQAGRWRDARMVQRYGARLQAKRGAAARLAVIQGRTKLPNDRQTK